MTYRSRLLAPLLFCGLSLTSSRHLGRLFTHSEAPFWTARNQCRFRPLHSDYPLYFMSFELSPLDLNKAADQDRYSVLAAITCAVANQSFLNGGIQHSLAQPLARYSFGLFLHSRLLSKTPDVGIHSALRWLLGLSSFVETMSSPKAVAVVVAYRVPMFLGLGFSVYGGYCLPLVFSSDLVTVSSAAQRQSCSRYSGRYVPIKAGKRRAG
jgi:hypothetical protein